MELLGDREFLFNINNVKIFNARIEQILPRSSIAYNSLLYGGYSLVRNNSAPGADKIKVNTGTTKMGQF